MNKEELVVLARELGLDEHLVTTEKKNLVREIQRALGQEACYQTDLRYRCNTTCEWVGCKKLTAEWLR